ncbi:DUF4334 domain-containing protein [Gordonia malaquae]|uniref:DUF4334 domain-containing protein n=1 Tax=Gordonia malaquae TaxID=410332 RepID=UPI00301599F5
MTITVADLQAGLPNADAAAHFDSLPGVGVDDVLGQWHGSEVPTGHPLDGFLAVSGWYGKRFDDADHVHPLLFGTPGSLFPVNPGAMPLQTLVKFGARFPRPKIPGVGVGFALTRTRRHRARLRRVEYRGVVSTSMVYDQLPIIDHFRALDQNTLFGAMDVRGSTELYFFLLERDW